VALATAGSASARIVLAEIAIEMTRCLSIAGSFRAGEYLRFSLS
jgi:hypothetical protein